MKHSGIYKIESKLKPERIYIGSAVNLSNRWSNHISSLKKNKHHSKKLQRHFNKYGESDLLFSILLGCEKKDLIKIEQYFLDSYNPYFNICKTAGSMMGLHWNLSEKTRLKMKQHSTWNKGKQLSDEHKKKISDRISGLKRSKETREKMSISFRNRKYNDETRKKMSDSAKNRKIISIDTRIKQSFNSKSRLRDSKGRWFKFA